MTTFKRGYTYILKNKTNNFVIILSLSVGLACIMLLSVFIHREMKTDSFNPDKERIFALYCKTPFADAGKMVHTRSGAAEYLKENFPEIEDYCRISGNRIRNVKVNDEVYDEDFPVVKVSSNFFDFFNYSLIQKANEKVLSTDKDIVISQFLAEKYFGKKSPIGKPITLMYNNKEKQFFVSAVFKHEVQNTQINFDMVTLLENLDSRCYVRLANKNQKEIVEQKMKLSHDKIPIIKGNEANWYRLLSMQDSYFETTRASGFENNRSKSELWIAFGIGLLVWVVAIFNYWSLLGNNLRNRNKTFAIQRLNGATHLKIVAGLLYENAIMVVLAGIISVLITINLQPFMNTVLNTNIELSYFFQLPVTALILLLILFCFIISALYVVFYVKVKLKTVKLQGKQSAKSYKMIPVFSVVQLAVVVILMICSFGVMKQITFMNNKEAGFDKQVLEVNIPTIHANKTNVFIEELEKSPYIKHISRAAASPVLEYFMVLLYYKENGAEKKYVPCYFSGDADYVKTLGVKILEGNDFTGIPSVDRGKCLVNKSLASMFPFQNLIGAKLPGDNRKTVIGIVEDFHFSGLQMKIGSAIISYNDQGNNILLKPLPGKEMEVKEMVAQLWPKLITDYPMDCEELAVYYNEKHSQNKKFIKLIGSCCVISILLSMFGMFAVSVDRCSKRIKEIGVRKVNGARNWEVLFELNSDFVKWLFISMVIAMPAASLLTNRWLENFAYRTKLGWWVFVLVALLTSIIVLITISMQAWRVAKRNPVEALRYE